MMDAVFENIYVSDLCFIWSRGNDENLWNRRF